MENYESKIDTNGLKKHLTLCYQYDITLITSRILVKEAETYEYQSSCSGKSRAGGGPCQRLGHAGGAGRASVGRCRDGDLRHQRRSRDIRASSLRDVRTRRVACAGPGHPADRLVPVSAQSNPCAGAG